MPEIKPPLSVPVCLEGKMDHDWTRWRFRKDERTGKMNRDYQYRNCTNCFVEQGRKILDE